MHKRLYIKAHGSLRCTLVVTRFGNFEYYFSFQPAIRNIWQPHVAALLLFLSARKETRVTESKQEKKERKERECLLQSPSVSISGLCNSSWCLRILPCIQRPGTRNNIDYWTLPAQLLVHLSWSWLSCVFSLLACLLFKQLCIASGCADANPYRYRKHTLCSVSSSLICVYDYSPWIFGAAVFTFWVSLLFPLF